MVKSSKAKLKKIKIRRAWKLNPITQVKKSKKAYNRQKSKRELKNISEEF